MRSFFDRAVQEEFRQRLEKLEQAAKGQWGKMSAAQMLAHCATAMKMTVGDLEIQPHPLRFLGSFFKKKLLNDKPFSKNSPTTREFVMKDELNFDTERSNFLTLFNRLAEGPTAVRCFQHPFFGKMTTEDWGRLVYKHIDHHFRQFGV